jgi:hypothetical protein
LSRSGPGGMAGCGNDFLHGTISCGLAARAGVYPRRILAGAAANGRRA